MAPPKGVRFTVRLNGVDDQTKAGDNKTAVGKNNTSFDKIFMTKHYELFDTEFAYAEFMEACEEIGLKKARTRLVELKEETKYRRMISKMPRYRADGQERIVEPNAGSREVWVRANVVIYF